MASGFFYVLSDTLVRIRGLKDNTGQIVNGNIAGGVTLAGRLADSKGVTVPGAEVITFVYVDSSSGDYTAELSHTLDLKDGKEYTLFVTVTIAGKQFTLKIARSAKYVEA